MSYASTDLLDAFRAAPEMLSVLLAGCTAEEARGARGGDEDWSVVEVVCHLRDAEERALERMRAMRDEDDPFIPSYDQEQWARERNYQGQDLHEALNAYARIKRQHLAELEALPAEAWERTGRHQEQGTITITNQTLHMVAHDIMHAAQIGRQLQQARSAAARA